MRLHRVQKAAILALDLLTAHIYAEILNNLLSEHNFIAYTRVSAKRRRVLHANIPHLAHVTYLYTARDLHDMPLSPSHLPQFPQTHPQFQESIYSQHGQQDMKSSYTSTLDPTDRHCLGAHGTSRTMGTPTSLQNICPRYLGSRVCTRLLRTRSRFCSTQAK